MASETQEQEARGIFTWNIVNMQNIAKLKKVSVWLLVSLESKFLLYQSAIVSSCPGRGRWNWHEPVRHPSQVKWHRWATESEILQCYDVRYRLFGCREASKDRWFTILSLFQLHANNFIHLYISRMFHRYHAHAIPCRHCDPISRNF